MSSRVFKRALFVTLFIKHNRYHRHSILIHTLKVAYYVFNAKEFKMIPASILHNIRKAIIVYQDKKDKITGEYSFTNHEEIGYQLIKSIF